MVVANGIEKLTLVEMNATPAAPVTGRGIMPM